MSKPILCLDFDGVLHSYTSGWQGAGVASDPPVDGSEAFLIEATKHFKVAIFSSRSKSLSGRWAMQRYVREHFDMPLTFSGEHDVDFLYEALSFPWFKPSAFVTIDDRALTFTGDWADFGIDALLSFKPWNKGGSWQPASKAAAPVVGDKSRDEPSPREVVRDMLTKSVASIAATKTEK